MYADPTALDGAFPDEAEPLDTVPCSICNRQFVADRLERHMKVCAKSQKKRKVFGESAERLKAREKAEAEEAKKRDDEKAGKKALWKQQSEAFQNAMKAAVAIKNGQAPPADLPPVEDTRTPCPHCGRKFDALVAERHIPKCATTKAKPNAVGGAMKRPSLGKEQLPATPVKRKVQAPPKLERRREGPSQLQS